MYISVTQTKLKADLIKQMQNEMSCVNALDSFYFCNYVPFDPIA